MTATRVNATTPRLHWRCLSCGLTATTTGGSRGDDAKHVEATQHGTVSRLREWAADGREG